MVFLGKIVGHLDGLEVVFTRRRDSEWHAVAANLASDQEALQADANVLLGA